MKLDRLGWAVGTVGTSFGVRIGLRASSASVLREMLQRVPPDWRPARGLVVDRLYSVLVPESTPEARVRRFSLAYAGTIPIGRALDTARVLDAFAQDLRLHVAEHARDRVFVHAGAVGWKGKAVLVPGSSMSGKSTLVRALVEAGATYYSDEYAAVDAHGRVHAFPAPLSIRAPDGRPATLLTPADLRSAAGGPPLEVGIVVATRHRAGAVWRPRCLTPARGLLALMAHAVPARTRPAETLGALSRIIDKAPVLSGVRGEAATTAERVLAAIAQGEAGPAAWLEPGSSLASLGS